MIPVSVNCSALFHSTSSLVSQCITNLTFGPVQAQVNPPSSLLLFMTIPGFLLDVVSGDSFCGAVRELPQSHMSWQLALTLSSLVFLEILILESPMTLALPAFRFLYQLLMLQNYFRECEV